jgi:hypothetical protein
MAQIYAQGSLRGAGVGWRDVSGPRQRHMVNSVGTQSHIALRKRVQRTLAIRSSRRCMCVRSTNWALCQCEVERSRDGWTVEHCRKSKLEKAEDSRSCHVRTVLASDPSYVARI